MEKMSVSQVKSNEDVPTMGTKRLRGENEDVRSTSAVIQQDFLPIFVTLLDEEETFQKMDIKDLNIVLSQIKKIASPLKSIKVARRGDIVINVSSEEQRSTLLTVHELHNRPVRAFSPNSAIKNKGVIYRVPTQHSDDDIRAMTDCTNIETVQRIHIIRNGESLPTGSGIITFKSKPPTDLKLLEVHFTVFPYIPNPKLCRKCWKIGHTVTTCSVKIAIGLIICKHCGTFHKETPTCGLPMKCLRCGGNDHEADNKGCPVYMENKEALRQSISQGIPLTVAKQQARLQYSDVAKMNTPNVSIQPNIQLPSQLPKQNAVIEQMQKQIDQLTQTITIIPFLQDSMVKMKQDFNMVLNNLDTKFETAFMKLSTSVEVTAHNTDKKIDMVIQFLQQNTTKPKEQNEPSKLAEDTLMEDSQYILQDVQKSSSSSTSVRPPISSPETGHHQQQQSHPHNSVDVH